MGTAAIELWAAHLEDDAAFAGLAPAALAKAQSDHFSTAGDLAKQTGLPGRVWGWDDNLRRRILWNLRDRRLPVLLLNCGPWPDWYLVTRIEGYWTLSGYGGGSSEGYRPNEPLDDPRNPLRHIELFDWMKGRQTWTISLTAKRAAPTPPLADLYRRALEWGATRLPRQTMKVLDAQGREFVSSKSYQDWAEMLASDGLFPTDQPDVLKQRRQSLSGDEVELAERRFYGADFLDLAARRLERPELHQAAGHFRDVNRLLEQVWAKLGGMEAPDAHLKLAERPTREAIAQLLLQMEAEDAAALLSR